MTRRTVFVGGLHGSGTSLVHRWLRSHPDISGFVGTGVPEDEGQHLQQVLPTARSLGGLGRFGFSVGAHLTEESDFAGSELASGVLSCWEPHWDPAAAHRVEKSPPNLLRFRLLQDWFSDALCVAVVRHPLAVAESTRRKRRRNRLMPLQGLVEHWLHCHEKFAEDRPHINELVELRYEDLVAAPESGLDAVFGALGLDSVPAPEAVVDRRNDEHGLRWQRRLSRPPRPRRLLALESRVSAWGYSIERFGCEVR